MDANGENEKGRWFASIKIKNRDGLGGGPQM
jgi:hypothetical protein